MKWKPQLSKDNKNLRYLKKLAVHSITFNFSFLLHYEKILENQFDLIQKNLIFVSVQILAIKSSS